MKQGPRHARIFASLAPLLVGLCVAQAGCSSPELVGEAPRELSRGDYRVVADPEAVTLTLYRGETQLSTIDASGLALGTAEIVDDNANYDPYALVANVAGYQPPGAVAFHAARTFSDLEVSGQELHANVTHEGGLHSRLTVRAERDGDFTLRLVPLEPQSVVWLRLGTLAPEGEAYYGLGELFDHVNQRGAIRAMQLEIDELEGANNEAHVPVPLLIGTAGWGLFVKSSYPGVFDVAATTPDHVAVTYGLGLAADQGITAHWLGAESPLDVTARYYAITGFPTLPAPWALGPLVWRDENEDQAQVLSDLETMRDLDLPASGIWIDRPYATGVNTFDFDAAKFTDPQAMIARAHQLGFRVALWHTPYLDEQDPNTEALRSEAEAAGYYPLSYGLLLNGWGRPIDFTVRAARSFWQEQLSSYGALGIEGYKLDYGEDIVPGLFGSRNLYTFHDGSDERTMHRGFTLLYHQTYAETLPQGGGLLLCRAGKWGDQIHGPVIWPGDLDARFWKHREQVEVDGKTIRAVGGLPASVVAGITLGPSGFPFFGADTGGYRHSPPDKELFRRWFEQTALSSVMQIGTSTNDVAWEFGDEELLDSYREYTRLHLRLFPYEWTLANEIARTGRPIQRPLGLVDPSLGVHPDDAYLFGDALLVAPVVEAGVDSREVPFPSGRWLGFWDDTSVVGPASVSVDAPLGKLPLFLRAGAVVPMLRPTIDTLAPTLEPGRVDSFGSDPGPLWVLASAGPESELTLYDGTVLSQRDSADAVQLGLAPGEVFDRGAVFELVHWGASVPVQVLVDSVTLGQVAPDALGTVGQGFSLDPADRGGTLRIKLSQGGDARIVRVVRAQ